MRILLAEDNLVFGPVPIVLAYVDRLWCRGSLSRCSSRVRFDFLMSEALRSCRSQLYPRPQPTPPPCSPRQVSSSFL
jgi:hypothetical protein